MTGTKKWKNDGKYEIYDTERDGLKGLNLSPGQLIAVMLLPEIQFDWRTFFKIYFAVARPLTEMRKSTYSARK